MNILAAILSAEKKVIYRGKVKMVAIVRVSLLILCVPVLLVDSLARDKQNVLDSTRSRWWFWSSKPKTMTTLHYHLEAVESTIEKLEGALIHRTPKHKDDLTPAKTIVDKLKDKLEKMENHLSTQMDDKDKNIVKKLQLEADKMHHAVETLDAKLVAIIDGTRHLNTLGTAKTPIELLKEDAKAFEKLLDGL